MARRPVWLGAPSGRWWCPRAPAGCGAGDPAIPSDAERGHGRRSTPAEFDFALAATAVEGEAGPVGFRMQGPFSVDQDRESPTSTSATRASWATANRSPDRVRRERRPSWFHDGARTRCRRSRPASSGSARATVASPTSGVAGWLEDPVVEERRTAAAGHRPGGRRRPPVRPGADQRPGHRLRHHRRHLDGDSARRDSPPRPAQRIRRRARPGDLPRNLRAVVDFGRRTASRAPAALGPYASPPACEVTLAVQPSSTEPAVRRHEVRPRFLVRRFRRSRTDFPSFLWSRSCDMRRFATTKPSDTWQAKVPSGREPQASRCRTAVETVPYLVTLGQMPLCVGPEPAEHRGRPGARCDHRVGRRAPLALLARGAAAQLPVCRMPGISAARGCRLA